MNKEETIAWIGLREIYKLVGSEDGTTIIKLLLHNNTMRSGELLNTSNIQAPKFHNLMKALVLSQVVERKVHQDRSVSYSISPFGKHILKLSEPLLAKIQEEFKTKDSMLLNLAQEQLS
jgi:hypothetical protein